MVFQLEADGGLKVFKLARPDLDVEAISLVGDLDDLGPGEAVDPQPVPVDEDAAAADPQHDVHALAVPGWVEADPVHGQLLGVVQVVELRLGRALALQGLVHLNKCQGL